MNELCQLIERFDPGHFSRRRDILEDMRKKVRDLGFFPLPLTQNDIECFWIRLEANDLHKGMQISLTREMYLDMLDLPDLMNAYKDVARCEEPNETSDINK